MKAGEPIALLDDEQVRAREEQARAALAVNEAREHAALESRGKTGGAAARELRKQGHPVRGLSHKDDARAEALHALGIETVVGDLLDLDATRRAMEGVAAAYFVYPLREIASLDGCGLEGGMVWAFQR